MSVSLMIQTMMRVQLQQTTGPMTIRTTVRMKQKIPTTLMRQTKTILMSPMKMKKTTSLTRTKKAPMKKTVTKQITRMSLTKKIMMTRAMLPQIPTA